MTTTSQSDTPISRRGWLRTALRTLATGALGGLVVVLHKRSRKACASPGSACSACPEHAQCDLPQRHTVWQLDPDKCIQCGQCATHCVLSHSAVRCLHTHTLCGYCKLCFGYFEPGAAELTSAAEHQLCPTNAIRREFVEDPYYEYRIDTELCIGCGKCVRGCNMFGNGSLYLQVNHAICLNCNACSIARACPANAFERVPASDAYKLKGNGSTSA